MPSFVWSDAMTASELGANPLAGWQFEYVPFMWPAGAIVKIMQRATTVNVRQTIYAGSTTIVERSPIQGGGTAGTTPSELNTTATVFQAAAGDRLKIANDEVGALVATVDGVIIIEPA